MKKRLIFFCALLIIGQFTGLKVSAQTQEYTQVHNTFEFNRNLSEQWSLELNLGQSWTTIPEQASVFSSLSQLYGRAWVHYRLNDKWKFSASYAYYYNQYVPEINQKFSPEWRSAIQATYYISRQRAVITTRWRLEDRHIANSDSVFEAVDRLRAQIKASYPFNGQIIALHVVYGILSDELMIKSGGKVSGGDFFDRNKFVIGLGYGITKNMQLEVTYCNEYLPRTPVSKSYNEIQLNVILNNFLPRLGKLIFREEKHPEAGTGD